MFPKMKSLQAHASAATSSEPTRIKPVAEFILGGRKRVNHNDSLSRWGTYCQKALCSAGISITIISLGNILSEAHCSLGGWPAVERQPDRVVWRMYFCYRLNALTEDGFNPGES
jgi:hypothetical protein